MRSLRPSATIGASAYVAFLLLTRLLRRPRIVRCRRGLSLGTSKPCCRREWWRAVPPTEPLALGRGPARPPILACRSPGLPPGAIARVWGVGRSILGAAVAWPTIRRDSRCSGQASRGRPSTQYSRPGMLAGRAWRQRPHAARRLWYRWAPLMRGYQFVDLARRRNAHGRCPWACARIFFGIAWVGDLRSRIGVAEPSRGGTGRALPAPARHCWYAWRGFWLKKKHR